MAQRTKKNISEPQLKAELIKLFESGHTAKANSYELLRTRFKIGKQRCLKAYDTALSDWQKLKEKAQSEQIHTNTTEALKSGLKSKTERIHDIQNQISELKEKLADNQDFKYMIVAGKVQKVVCEIDLSTRAYLHKTIKELESEISKMQGDYTSTKVEVSGKNGKPIETKNYNVSLSKEEIIDISKQLENSV